MALDQPYRDVMHDEEEELSSSASRSLNVRIITSFAETADGKVSPPLHHVGAFGFTSSAKSNITGGPGTSLTTCMGMPSIPGRPSRTSLSLDDPRRRLNGCCRVSPQADGQCGVVGRVPGSIWSETTTAVVRTKQCRPGRGAFR